MLGSLRISLPLFGASLPDAVLAAVFLVAWIDPLRLGPGIVGWCMLVMLLEFAIIHSAVFFGNMLLSKATLAEKLKSSLGLGALYTLLVMGFALAFKTWWPLISFWALSGKRMIGIFMGVVPAGEEKQLMQRTWAASVMFYLLAVFVTVLAPVPRLGITPSVVDAANLPGTGGWVDHPEKVVAFGFLYFSLMTLSGMHGHRWAQEGIPKDPAAGAAPGSDPRAA